MKIESYAAACAALGIDPAFRPDTTGIPENFKAQLIAHFQMMVWIEAINSENPIDWTNSGQIKYEPWFKWSSSVGGFVYRGCDNWRAVAHVGAHLCLTDPDDLISTVQIPEFVDIINKFLPTPTTQKRRMITHNK